MIPVETEVSTSGYIEVRRLAAAWMRFIVTTYRLGIHKHIYSTAQAHSAYYPPRDKHTHTHTHPFNGPCPGLPG